MCLQPHTLIINVELKMSSWCPDCGANIKTQCGESGEEDYTQTALQVGHAVLVSGLIQLAVSR